MISFNKGNCFAQSNRFSKPKLLYFKHTDTSVFGNIRGNTQRVLMISIGVKTNNTPVIESIENFPRIACDALGYSRLRA